MLPNATDLGTFESAKASLARAKAINDKMAAERVRLNVAIRNAVTVAFCLLLVAGAIYFEGYPGQQRLDRIAQEQGR